MPLFIYGLGTATPPFAIAQEHAVQAAEQFGCHTHEQRRLLRALYRLSRVRTRHSVILESDSRDGLTTPSFFPPMRDEDDRGPGTSARMARYEREAPILAAAAARVALRESRTRPDAITHLISVSCTGFAAPGFDVVLIRELGLSRAVERTHIGFMGCHGALNGLRVARAYADSVPGARVLLCAVELCSLHFQYGWNPNQIVANAIFGDGAAALVGCADKPAADDIWQNVASGATLLEDSSELMTWRVGDHGFEMTLSPLVPNVIKQRLRPWIDTWLGQRGLDVDAVATWALHPGGPRILEACATTLRLPPETYAVSRDVLAEFGNMSSPTILFIIDRLRQRNAPRPCVAVGFGPGLAVEAALFR